MRDKIKEYIDFIFRDAPTGSRVEEIKEEMLSNTLDKYEDLICQGESEQSAYNLAVASIGDVSELIDDISGVAHVDGRDSKEKVYSKNIYDEANYSIPQKEIMRYRARTTVIRPIYIILYILSIVPSMIFHNETGAVLMIVLVAAATGLAVRLRSSRPKCGDDEYKKYAAKAAIIRPIYIMLYILSVTGAMMFRDEKGAVMMFCFIAAATGLAVYLRSLRPTHIPKKQSKGGSFSTTVRLTHQNARLLNIISSIIWISVVALYICINLFMHMWSNTWIIFLIGWVLYECVKTILRIKEVR